VNEQEIFNQLGLNLVEVASISQAYQPKFRFQLEEVQYLLFDHVLNKSTFSGASL